MKKLLYPHQKENKTEYLPKKGKNTNEKIAEALYEILTGLHGFRDQEHTQWEKQAKTYLKRLTAVKNLFLDGNTIEIQDYNGDKTFYKITIIK